MINTSPDFDHAAICIPGVTLSDDPAAAARAICERVDAARQSPSPNIPHADVMADMRARTARAGGG